MNTSTLNLNFYSFSLLFIVCRVWYLSFKYQTWFSHSENVNWIIKGKQQHVWYQTDFKQSPLFLWLCHFMCTKTHRPWTKRICIWLYISRLTDNTIVNIKFVSGEMHDSTTYWQNQILCHHVKWHSALKFILINKK